MTVWEMVEKAMGDIVVQSGNPVVEEKKIKDYIDLNYKNVNPGTINNQIMFCTVNRQSRVNDTKNQRNMICNRESDFLFRPNLSKAEVVLYHPDEHGLWEIYQSSDSKYNIRKIDGEPVRPGNESEQDSEKIMISPSHSKAI